MHSAGVVRWYLRWELVHVPQLMQKLARLCSMTSEMHVRSSSREPCLIHTLILYLLPRMCLFMLLYEATGAGALVALVSDPTQVTQYHQKDTGRGTLLLLSQCQAQNVVVIVAIIFFVAPYIQTLAGPTCPPLPTLTSTCTFGAAGAVTSVLKKHKPLFAYFAWCICSHYG